MTDTDRPVTITPSGRWGKYRVFSTKIGTLGSCQSLIKRVRIFHVGQIVEYIELDELTATAKSVTPRWKMGRIHGIRGRLIAIEKL